MLRSVGCRFLAEAAGEAADVVHGRGSGLQISRWLQGLPPGAAAANLAAGLRAIAASLKPWSRRALALAVTTKFALTVTSFYLP